MTIKELEAKVKVMEKDLRILQDMEEIKKLQRAYGYYLEHWMAEEIIPLFSDNPKPAGQGWVPKREDKMEEEGGKNGFEPSRFTDR